jgi:hypothetical protein
MAHYKIRNQTDLTHEQSRIRYFSGYRLFALLWNYVLANGAEMIDVIKCSNSVEPKIFTFNFTYVSIEHDCFECEADDYGDAEKQFDEATQHCGEDVEISSYSERPAPPYIDPNQIPLPGMEPVTVWLE